MNDCNTFYFAFLKLLSYIDDFLLQVILFVSLAIPFYSSSHHNSSDLNSTASKKLLINTIPRPIRQVNYGIRTFENAPNKEYISLEIWTDGTLDPKDAVDCALQRVTQMFYNLTLLNKNVIKPQNAN